ncbi:hypothetical protein CDD83_9740 [Cordyceps sp. RAO-2017]|nr:hypothetical protein CDD83_9740 [Cordyceps sp. RAO-2017]
MRQPNLPVHEYARDMGEALAIMHWAAHINAYDVEFVMGSEPWSFRYPGPQSGRRFFQASYPHLDSGLQLVQSAPHGQALKSLVSPNADSITASCSGSSRTTRTTHCRWSKPPKTRAVGGVSSGLHKRGEKILGSGSKWAIWANDKKLPERFTAMCVEREKKDLADSRGHGHREEKQ